MRCIRRKRLRAHRYRGHAAPGRKCQARYIASTTMTINTATTHAIRKATPPSAKNGVDAVRPAATSCSSLRASGLSACGTVVGSLALSSGRFITEVRYPVHTRQNPPRAPRVSGRLQGSLRDRNPRERIPVLRQLSVEKRGVLLAPLAVAHRSTKHPLEDRPRSLAFLVRDQADAGDDTGGAEAFPSMRAATSARSNAHTLRSASDSGPRCRITPKSRSASTVFQSIVPKYRAIGGST